MTIDLSINRTGRFSGVLKSFLQQVRTRIAEQGAPSYDQDSSASDWDAFLGEALQQSAPSSEDARERRAAIAQILQSADASTKTSIADCLLFASDLDEAHDTIMMRDQQRRQAA
jgi:hypothetical protein